MNAVISYLEEAGLIKPRRDKDSNYLVPVGKDVKIRWRDQRATQRDDAKETEGSPGAEAPERRE